MPQLKLRIKKSGAKNPVTKQLGFAARVLTNGTAEFDDVVKEAGRNTTMHKAELKMAFELCLDSVSDMLKQGYIVDLGLLGKIYPSCSSGWFEKAEDLKLENVKPGLYYRPGDEVEAAVKSAKLVWAKAEDEDEETTEGGGNGNGNDNGGGNVNDNVNDNGGGDNGGGGGIDDLGDMG